MKVALVTIAAGRHAHLRAQRAALTRCHRCVDFHILAAMDDPHIARVAASVDVPGCRTLSVDVPRVDQRLPLARARNVGAQTALEHGADVLIFLDVDCLPGSLLIERYVHALQVEPGPSLCSGPVAYLPPPPRGGYELSNLHRITQGHPSRPTPAEDSIISADPRLFWSLSFAIDARTWHELGGFHERYTGYGAEDTDYGQVAAAHGVQHVWVGGAWAYHQYHPSSDPPQQHLHDILHNARIFHQRWGWWPMRGWLEEFERRGLTRYDAINDAWAATSTT